MHPLFNNLEADFDTIFALDARVNRNQPDGFTVASAKERGILDEQTNMSTPE